MNNETTKILNTQQNSVNKSVKTVQTKENKELSNVSIVGSSVIGSALGAGAVLAVERVVAAPVDSPDSLADVLTESAALANQTVDATADMETATEEPSTQTSAMQQNGMSNSSEAATVVIVGQQAPSEQNCMLMTDEGIKVAHVDDSLTFSQAFAEARHQVGAGGVFEWHGKVYGTYYKTEWDNMSDSEHAEWRAKIDYNDVLDSDNHSVAPDSHYASTVPSNGTYVDHESSGDSQQTQTSGGEDNEVHVVGVAVQGNGQGGTATIAALCHDGDMAVVVDIDSNGTIDFVMHDNDGDGQIDQSEIHVVNSSHVSTGDVINAFVNEAHAHGAEAVVTNLDSGEQMVIPGSGPFGNVQAVSYDDTPDYMNNADAGFMDD
ncbi:MAG: hypothetical protein U0K71_13770 [Paludibacteraceae bacterium]|nr:hypothetical protein [Paludibacteraceae bacterium]